MRKLPYLLTLALLLAAPLTYAQTAPTAPAGQDTPYIEVNGTAEREVVPDEIYLRIVLRERYAGKTKITLAEQTEKLQAALKTLGIAPGNLALSDANADLVRIRRQADVVTQQEYQLKVADAATVTKVFAELDRIGITDADIARVSHSQLPALRREVKIQAIKAAKDKAEYLLTAIGEHPGKPLEVRETEASESGLTPAGRSRGGSALSNAVLNELSGSADGGPQFRKLRIQSTIYVKFGIK